MDERIVAKIRKNATKEIWVVLTDYSGELRLDLRERFQGDDGGFLPTKKGVAIQLSELPALAAALQDLIGAMGLGTVATFGRTAKAEIRASICSYEGHSYAEVRRFIRTGGSEEWKHGKGVTLNQALVPSLFSAVQDAIELTKVDAASKSRRDEAGGVRASAKTSRAKARRRS